VNLLSTGQVESDDLTPFDPTQPDADKVLFPEYLTCDDKSWRVASHVIEWLSDPARRTACVKSLEALRARVGHGGASVQAAKYILGALPVNSPALPRPHFQHQEAAARLS
jgi:hypothetical protein